MENDVTVDNNDVNVVGEDQKHDSDNVTARSAGAKLVKLATYYVKF